MRCVVSTATDAGSRCASFRFRILLLLWFFVEKGRQVLYSTPFWATSFFLREVLGHKCLWTTCIWADFREIVMSLDMLGCCHPVQNWEGYLGQARSHCCQVTAYLLYWIRISLYFLRYASTYDKVIIIIYSILWHPSNWFHASIIDFMRLWHIGGKKYNSMAIRKEVNFQWHIRNDYKFQWYSTNFLVNLYCGTTEWVAPTAELPYTQSIPNYKMFDFFNTNHSSYSKICVKYHFFRRGLVY